MNNVEGCVEFPLTVFAGENTELAPSNIPQGLSPGCSDMAFQPGQGYTRPPLQVLDTLGTTAQVLYSTSYTQNDGTVIQLRFTSDGGIYANGVLLYSTAAGNRFLSIPAFGRVYIATSDGLHGADVPLQYDGIHLDRVSQDGPGAASVFSASSITTDSYPISSITQPAPGFAPHLGTFDAILWSEGPGSMIAGNVITFYYANALDYPPDTVLTAAFNSGIPLYLYISDAPVGTGTSLVTGIGIATPPGGSNERYYFTIVVPTVNSQYFGGHAYPGQYQITAATVTTDEQVPGLSVGDSVQIAGTSVPGYISTWPIVQALDSGTLNITGSSLTAGVATFNFRAVGTTPAPYVGQLVAIAGTLNANGALNNTVGVTVPNWTIASVSGGTSGTFTVTGFEATQNYAFVTETGSGVTAGTRFVIDPGLAALGGTNSPIFGESTGGTLTFIASTNFIAPGTRQGVVFWITRTGYLSIPSPSATFTITDNINAIRVDNLPIGNSNVIGRGVAFTAANGGSFFYLPIAAQLLGVTYGTSTVVNNNTDTSATFNFTDQSLLAATAIDIPGNDLFNQVVLGPVLGFFAYAGRIFPWGERNKIQNLMNMGFEGGTLGGSVLPLGWMAAAGAGAIVASGVGQAWQITGGGTGTDGLISQPAFEDSFNVPILTPLTQYTFRLKAVGAGSVTAQFYSPSTGTVLATASIPAGSGFAEAVMSAQTPAVIPADTVLKVFATGLTAGQFLTLDEIELYYTNNPYLRLSRSSYIQNPESFDGVTGVMGPASDPNEIRTMFERNDVLHLLTAGPEGNLYEVQNTASGEPATWSVSHRASKCGAISAWGDDKFEDWQVWASDTGLRLYDGGTVEKMSQEEQTWWDSFNPAQTQFTVVRNDPYRRRIYMLAATGTETITNTTYVLDYRDLNTSAALASAGTLRISYTGKMITTDLTRKWSRWTVLANYCGLLILPNGDEAMGFCGATGFEVSNPAASTTYTLDEGNLSGIDADYGSFWATSLYTTYGFVSPDEAQGKQLGAHRLLHRFATMTVTGNGMVTLQPLLGSLDNPGRTTRPVAISPDMTKDIIFALEAAADRVYYQIGCQPAASGGPAGFQLSLLTIAVVTHPFSPITGWNQPDA